MKKLSDYRCFGGQQQRWQHYSQANACDMTFGIFLPPQCSNNNPMPAIYWLSGLTCNDENFVQKAGAQRLAAELGIILITPDTSPRGDDIADDPEQAWDFGLGAGFYVNATQQPWQPHYQMYTYITDELPAVIAEHFSFNGKSSISGHSMGGHGALICALKDLNKYCSVSAFAPICQPTQCPWGQKALTGYLGSNMAIQEQYDSCAIIKEIASQAESAQQLNELAILVDQGLEDTFLADQLRFQALETALSEFDNKTLNSHEGYDHSYFFIASFIEQHLRFHHQYLTS